MRESGEANEHDLDRLLDVVIQERTDNTEKCASNVQTESVMPQSSDPITLETGTNPCIASTAEMGTDARRPPMQLQMRAICRPQWSRPSPYCC